MTNTVTATDQKKAAYKIPFPHYHSQLEMVSELTYLAGEFSEIAELVSIGRSVEGREITGLKISTDVRRRTDLKPQAVAVYTL